MPFDKETASLAGKKSKRGKAKQLDPTIKEKMEILYESVLDHLIVHQTELSMSDRVRLVQSLSNYLLPKTKSVRDEFTLEKRLKKEIKKGFLRTSPIQESNYSIAATFIKASA